MTDKDCLDLDDGYTRLVHGIADALARTNLPGECSRILWVVFRKTYGFGKKEDRISLSQFAESTGMSRSHCHRAIKKLIAQNIIKQSWGVYQFNKYSDTWLYPNQGTPTVPQSGNSTVPKLGRTVPHAGYKTVPHAGTTKDIKIITKDNSCTAVPQLGYTPGQDRKVYDLLMNTNDWQHVVRNPNPFGWIRGLLRDFGMEKVEATIKAITEYYTNTGYPPPTQVNARIKIRDWCKRERMESPAEARRKAIETWEPEE